MPTVRIDDKRWREMEKLAVKATIEHQIPVSTPDVLKSLIDNHLPDLKTEKILETKNKKDKKWNQYYLYLLL